VGAGLCYNSARRGANVLEQGVKRVKEAAGPADKEAALRAGTPGSAQAAASASELQGEYALRYCPVCSQRLESRRCKLICNQCGYYMSCADYI
jgi:NADH pyrophosphatase NudC (nudix superfamily)